MKAQQGNLYNLHGKEVRALSTGERITVADLDKSRNPTGQVWIVDAADLVPLGMRDYSGRAQA